MNKYINLYFKYITRKINFVKYKVNAKEENRIF